jgi:hypothetical protein
VYRNDQTSVVLCLGQYGVNDLDVIMAVTSTVSIVVQGSHVDCVKHGTQDLALLVRDDCTKVGRWSGFNVDAHMASSVTWSIDGAPEGSSIMCIAGSKKRLWHSLQPQKDDWQGKRGWQKSG